MVKTRQMLRAEKRAEKKAKAKRRIDFGRYELDPELWTRLPEELIEKVVISLPLPRVAKFRVVCKKWNCFIISRRPPEIDHLAPQGSRLPVLLYGGRQSGNRNSGKWMETFHTAKIDSNPSWKSEWKGRPTSFPFSARGEVMWLEASEAGLLFFTCHRRFSITNWLVCNPLLGQTKRISPPSSLQSNLSHDSRFFGVGLDKETNSYKLVFAASVSNEGEDRLGEEARCRWSGFVYDSLSCSWKSCAPGALAPKEGDWQYFYYIGRSVYCDGSLYWLAYCSSRRHELWSNGIVVVRYDLGNDTWSLVETDFHRKRKSHKIILYQGQVAFCRFGKMKTQCRVWPRKLDVPCLSYQSLIRVEPVYFSGDENVPCHMFHCFSSAEFCIQVHGIVDMGSTSEFEDHCGFQVTVRSTVKDVGAHVIWRTLSTYHRGPENIFSFSPSLSMLP